jgi:hypothetical protein
LEEAGRTPVHRAGRRVSRQRLFRRRCRRGNGEWILIGGYHNGLWAKGLGGGSATPWRRIGSKQITGAPTAAGTREPVPYMIAAVRDTHGAPWITRYPTASGCWAAFFLAWKPQG